MIYIYRRANSDGAQALAAALQGRRVKAFNRARRRDPADVIVCWGEADPQVPGITKILNGVGIRNKYEDAVKLKEAGVPTVEVSRTRPQAGTRTIPLTYTGELRFQNATREQIRARIRELEEIAARPDQTLPGAEWLGRRFNHVGGSDLLHPPVQPDYWSRREKLTDEFRLHIFNGKSIRAGQKVHVDLDGRPIHEWIRSLEGGWRIKYDDFGSTKRMRELATKAVKALGLDFGAVDLAKREDGTLIVLEVNRAPGLEGNTITAYADAIKGVLEGA